LSELVVLLEDNHLLAVAKPAGLLVQGDRSGHETLLDLARAYLKDRYAKPGNVYLGLVHRLDRPVSGVVLLARTSKAASRLSRQFREKTVAKRYLAVTESGPAAPEGELVAHLAGQGDARGVTRAATAPFPGSRPASLRYRVRGRQPDRSLLEVELITGRRHQIRAQLALAGWPIRGDVKYGAARQADLAGIALHGWRLTVAHPVGGAPVAIEAPLPPDWPWTGPWTDEETG
jgi:23S rRNA pseudouridine1911/1915/1917 synthase